MKPVMDTVTKEWTVCLFLGVHPSPELPTLPNPPYHALLGLYHMKDCKLPKEKSIDGPPVRGSSTNPVSPTENQDLHGNTTPWQSHNSAGDALLNNKGILTSNRGTFGKNWRENALRR